ncbi:MAG: IS110 family transposase [Phycisphaeraceae bacterium]
MNAILAIDLGKFKSVACTYHTGDGQHTFRTLPTRPQAIHKLIVEVQPDRVVIEVGSAAGWVKDVCEALEIDVAVANPNHEAWRWKSVKRKTDKDDALKLAQLSAMGQLPTVRLPSTRVRQWRSFIAYRHTLIARRTAIKNSIRAILDRQGLTHACGKSGWTQASIAALHELARPLEQLDADELWRGQLHVELQALEQIEQLIEPVEAKLEALAEADSRVARLRTIPGVGPRLAETVVAMIDDPKRFKNAKQVGAYAGLVPRQIESGTISRTGRITGRGNKLLRGLLVEVAWLTRRYNDALRQRFDRVCRGSKSRRKIAVVATARKLLVICWAMLRDGAVWRESSPAAAPGG